MPGPNGGQADFSFGVRFQKSRRATKIIGSFTYTDSASGISLHASKFSSLTFDGNQAHFTGTARMTRRSTVGFSVDATDNGDGTFDVLSVQLTNGYSDAGNLSSGNISIQ